jgi:ATP/maltotriose-dependent transcriptional regulator MalT
MASTTPIVQAQEGVLKLRISSRRPKTITLDSPAWRAWLREGRSFRFVSHGGVFTARRETRTGQNYWYAFRRINGRLHSAYIGKPNDVCGKRLHEVARDIARPPTTPDMTCLARLISSHAEALMRRGELRELQAWGEAVPAQMRHDAPELGMWLAWALCLGEAPERAEPVIRSTERRVRELAKLQSDPAGGVGGRPTLNLSSVLNQLVIIRAIVARRAHRFEQALELLSAARASLPATDHALASVIATQLALIHADRGDLDAARRCFAQAAADAEYADHALLQVSAMGGLAGLNLRLGREEQAQALASRVQQVARTHNVALTDFLSEDARSLMQATPLASLRPRERDVLACMVQGWGDAEIACRLGIATSTVRWHCKNIFAKLGVHRRIQAIAVARGGPTD